MVEKENIYETKSPGPLLTERDFPGKPSGMPREWVVRPHARGVERVGGSCPPMDELSTKYKLR